MANVYSASPSTCPKTCVYQGGLFREDLNVRHLTAPLLVRGYYESHQVQSLCWPLAGINSESWKAANRSRNSAIGCATAPLPETAGSKPQLDPLVEYRYQGVVERNTTGATARSQQVIAAFKKQWACPANGAHSGACPGWAIDHVIPLDCGGVDAVWNMQWLPDQIKSQKGEFSKDHFERRIYGGTPSAKVAPEGYAFRNFGLFQTSYLWRHP